MSSQLWGDIPDWIYDVSRSLMSSLAIVDPITHQHCLRVGELSRKLARDSGLNEYEQKLAEFAGLFHDIGKMGISQEIIAKPGRLEPKEVDIMRGHSVMSEDIIRPIARACDFFNQILPAVRGHHERVDGEGYPDKLMGDQVPFLARVILVVDTYDAMSQTRAYRKGLPDEVIYAELKRCAGTQFDAHLVRIFLEAHANWSGEQNDQETQFRIAKPSHLGNADNIISLNHKIKKVA